MTPMQPLGENSVNVPAFLHKLWKMVNDPKTNHLICWSSAGTSFTIQNKAAFWYELLPLYYKHNNMSSFIRQLNMYGFHKISSSDSAGKNERDEIHFYHHNFQRDKPEILKHIRRKVTNSLKTNGGDMQNNQNILSTDEINRVFADITVIKGRQSNVDSQLTAMKQENAILWRELALLRQKHIKQQQIVNKLIQFLVTLVHPSRLNGLSTKRVLPLMIHESPAKKPKVSKPGSTSSDGPTIRELETPEELQSDLLDEAAESVFIDDNILTPDAEIEYNQTPEISGDMVEELFSDGETVTSDPIVEILTFQDSGEEPNRNNEIFVTPESQDTLLSNLMNGNYNIKSMNDVLIAGTSASTTASAKKSNNGENEETSAAQGKTIARKDVMRRLNSVIQLENSREDLGLHLESTQSELDKTFKELLAGCSSLNANAFLDLFNDEASPSYGLGNFDDSSNLKSGSELTTYAGGLDFTQLLNEDSNELVAPDLPITDTLNDSESITTPQIVSEAPTFPTLKPAQ